MIKGDSTIELNNVSQSEENTGFNLLFTSPPYYAITDYHYDQWLRLWMLGGEERPVHMAGASVGRFDSKAAYRDLLLSVFKQCAKVMREDGIVYVRTDARKFTFDTTVEVLREVFPNKNMETLFSPFPRNTQTALYGDKQAKPGEMDIVLKPQE